MNPWEMYGGQTVEQKQDVAPWEQYTPEQAPKKEGLVRTVFDQAMQGATFGFADEVSDSLGAGIASLATRQPYGQMLSEARELTKERQARQWEDQPGASITANLAGGLLTGGAGATTKAGATAGNFIRSGNTAARIGKGAAAGAASGGLYGFGSEMGEERAAGLGRGAVLGATIGGAVPAVGGALSRINTKITIPGSDEIRKKASGLYQKAEQFGGMMKPEFTNQFLAKAQKSLMSDDELINAMKSNAPMREAMGDLMSFQNQPMTLSRAQALDEQLGNMIDGFVDNQGNLQKAGKKLLDVQRGLRDMIENADDGLIQGGREGFEALKEGRKLWAVSRRLNDVERIIENAETYQVPATAIKTGFRRLYNSSKILGYSPDEVKAIKRAAETGMATDLMATFGSRLGPIVGMTQGPAGAALGYATSTAARAGATSSQMSRANAAARKIAERSGMVEKTKRIKLPKILQSVGIASKSAPNNAGASAHIENKAMRSLPAPDRAHIVSKSGDVRMQTPAEAAQAAAERQRLHDLGLTPDVARAIDQNVRNDLMRRYGGSDLGQFLAENPNITLEQAREEMLRRIMKMPPADAQKALKNIR